MCRDLAMNKPIFAYMKPFLKQVADLYYSSGRISDRCFIFPNRRAMVFFRKHLADAVAADQEARPFLMPEMLTINDFFHKTLDIRPSDKVRLLLALYEAYSAVNPSPEPLDEFIFWGDVILGDFDDVDKYLVNPRQIFTNIKDYKEIQDSLSYLSETQRKAVEALVSHFKDRSGLLVAESGKTDVKSRFLLIWNILCDLYFRYREVLASKEMAYEGMVYRTLAEKLSSETASSVFSQKFEQDVTFVFVGLNALNECEKAVLRSLRNAGMAEFCWDWTGKMIRDGQNKASFFMKDNLKEFPQVDGWSEPETVLPEVNIVSVASSTGMAKRLPDILSKVGKDTAVVLPDENLLIPVLNSIPESIRDINVTMGLPMKGSLLYAMMADVSSMQLHTVCRSGKWFFYHKQVWDIFSSTVFRKAADGQTDEIVARVREAAKYYIPQEELSGTPLLDAVFRPVVTDPKDKSSGQIEAFAAYQKEVVSALAAQLTDDPELALELEYAREYHKCVSVIQEIGLEVLPVTYVRLLDQLLGAVSVHFKGEPLKGLQIMGPLETRALDFENMIILSANEGVFPRRSVSSSFIPPELRRGFQMPTYEYQDAMWAYYFYRMISRARSVWMLVDTRTEGLKSGEESRFIKQLEYHFRLPVRRYVVKFGAMGLGDLQPVEKTEDDVARIKDTVLSATALQNYLACPAKFYYSVVKGLRSEDEVSESLDYGMFGTVYHEVMRSLYSDSYAMRPDFFFDDRLPDGGLPVRPMERITREYMEGWLSREADIKLKVRSLIVRQLNAMEVTGRNLVVADVISMYVTRTLQRDLELLDAAGRDSFRILGRELKVNGEFHGQRFKGFIDRLDSFSDDQARVVDYKTGKVLEDDWNIHDGNAEAIAETIFAPDVKDRPKIALQFFIYDMLLQGRPEAEGRNIWNCVYSTSSLFKEAPKTVPLNHTFHKAVSGRLASLLDEMYDLSLPFRRTEDAKVCEFCDFKNICGR